MSNLPTKEAFEAQVNTNFKLFIEEDSFDLTLFECKGVISNPIQECFSLMFLAPNEMPAYQSLFRVEHSALGAFDLFLVPIKQDEKGLQLEAVFNNLLHK
ncbi:MAG TPA: hypothetical protein PKE69_14010 [Pyrinomonadaceae bacterium]|nr:hypothetical protein [Pyrinomonadaceae bacterium]